MIELRGIYAGYRGQEVLRDLNLRLETQRITAVVGPNGSGKSTLLRVAARLLAPAAGTVLLAGQPVERYGRKEFARRDAVLPQARNTPALTAEALVLHGRFPHLGLSRQPTARDRELAGAAMERVGIYGLRKRSLRELSGGERQKAYLAMAIAQDAAILLLDEPTTYLDIGGQFEVLELLAALNAEGRTIGMVMHDLSHALRFSDRIALLRQGQLAAFGSPDEVLDGGMLEDTFGVRIHRVPGAAGYYFTH